MPGVVEQIEKAPRCGLHKVVDLFGLLDSSPHVVVAGQGHAFLPGAFPEAIQALGKPLPLILRVSFISASMFVEAMRT
jgi:hypothetical protein